MSRTFVFFAVVGAAAAIVNVLAGRLFALFFDLELAVVLAFPIALTFAYAMNKKFVFRTRSRASPVEYGRFLAVNLAALGVVWCVTILLARLVFPMISLRWHAEALAHAIGVASPIALSFWAHKTFTFRPRGNAG